MPEEENVAVEPVRVRGALPHKRRINLAKVTQKRVPWERYLLAAVGVIAAVTFFVRHAVLARFEALRDAEQKLEAAQKEFDDIETTLNDYYKSRDVYVHVTWSDMTEKEIGMVDPTDVAHLLERVVLPFSPLDGWSLSENSVTLTVHTNTLEDTNELARRLREEPMVKYCSVRRGGRGGEAENSVSSEIVVYFNSADNSKIGARGG